MQTVEATDHGQIVEKFPYASIAPIHYAWTTLMLMPPPPSIDNFSKLNVIAAAVHKYAKGEAE
jgi:hypothetical protein